MPPPSDPDPAGAARVQELMGGRFGEMSTFMNYTFQSFNFRNRQGARPFYDLIANIAAEEFGHIELVAVGDQHDAHRRDARRTTARPPSDALEPTSRTRRSTRTTSSPAARARCCQDSRGNPWTGDNVFSSGDLVEDLTHNFFLETGARNNKLKVYEMCDHPAARALTGYLLVRGGVHQVAYARAVELLTGADLIEDVPVAADPDRQDPRVPAAHREGQHLKLYRFSPDDYKEIVAVFNGPHPETGEPLEVVDEAPEGALPQRPAVAAGRLRARLRARGDRGDRRRSCARRRACPTSRSGEVANPANGSAKKTVKKAAKKAKSKAT